MIANYYYHYKSTTSRNVNHYYTSDCGMFAIAVITSLLLDEDPSMVTYKQEKLREHLIECLTVEKLYKLKVFYVNKDVQSLKKFTATRMYNL